MLLPDPLTTSQNLIVLVRLPDARVLPSGLNATAHTAGLTSPNQSAECPTREAIHTGVVTFHSLATLSCPEARISPLGLKATENTVVSIPRVAIFSPLATSHNLTRSWEPPDARNFTFGLHATEKMCPACPLRVRVFGPLGTSHNLTVPSVLPDANTVPSGFHATDSTPPLCPSRVTVFLPLATSQS